MNRADGRVQCGRCRWVGLAGVLSGHGGGREERICGRSTARQRFDGVQEEVDVLCGRLGAPPRKVDVMARDLFTVPIECHRQG
jgi:hypothetical protein